MKQVPGLGQNNVRGKNVLVVGGKLKMARGHRSIPFRSGCREGVCV